MKDALEMVLRFGLRLVAVVDRIKMGEARQRRLALELGIDLSIPETKIRDVSDTVREEIIAERAKVTETEWLRSNGPRDQICTALGLTTEQVAGVLAASTRRTNGNGHTASEPEAVVEPEFEVDEPEAALPPLGITHDPKTWPTREAKVIQNEFPPRGKPEYEIDDTDYKIVRAVMDKGEYDKLRKEIARVRRLATQQVAGIKAAITSGNGH